MTKLTQEQLLFAKGIGATHRSSFGLYWRIDEDGCAWKWSPATSTWVRNIDYDDSPALFYQLVEIDQKPDMGSSKMNASEVLQRGIDHMKDREKTYDAEGGERSMGKTVTMFNTLYGKTITEEEGWAFMCLLKLVRTSQGAYRSDNYEDLAAYAGLMCESAQELEK